jgi:glutathione peroxidase
MKTLLISVALLCLFNQCTRVVSAPTENIMTTGSFYDFKLAAIDGKTIDFSAFKGKKVLIVNTASECGYTPQYAGLQELHEKHGDKVVILGFPCNNFGGQEPGSSDEIASFCSKNYGVTFQMMEKVKVKGDGISPLYTWLTSKEANGWNEEAPNWNFCKYLINEEGKLVNFFTSGVKPMSEELTSKL